MFGGSMKLDHQRFSALFVLLICALVSVNNSYAQQMVQQPELVKVMPSGVKGSPTDVLAELSDIKITRDMYDKEVEAFKQVAQPQATAQLITHPYLPRFLLPLLHKSLSVC